MFEAVDCGRRHRWRYVATAFQGLADENDKLVAPGWPFYPTEVENPYPYDPDRAKELVAEGGLEGAPVTILVGPPSAAPPLGTDVAQVMQQQLDAVGFDTEIVNVQNSFAELPTADWNIYLGSFTDPAALIEFLVPERVGNACGYDNPDVTAAVLETRDATLDDEELVDAWAGFQQAVYDDLPVFNIATQFDLAAHADNVQGVTGDISNGDLAVWAGIYMTGD